MSVGKRRMHSVSDRHGDNR